MGFLMHPNDTQFPPPGPPPRARYLLVGPTGSLRRFNLRVTRTFGVVHFAGLGKVLRLYTSCKVAVSHQLACFAITCALEPLPRS